MNHTKLLLSVVTVLAISVCSLLGAQSTGSLSQTVKSRNTIGTLSLATDGTLIAGDTVTLKYQLSTAGAPAPTSDTVQFYDGSTAIGPAQAILSASASNLLPYSEVNLNNGWSSSGTTPTVTASSATGADSSSKTASSITFIDNTSTVRSAVSDSTNYAGQTITYSFYALAESAGTLTMSITDSPASSASKSSTCSVSTTFSLCSLTYTFPANAGPGFAVYLSSPSTVGVAFTVSEVQVNAGSERGGYVSTIGVPRATGGESGSVTFSYDDFHAGTHTITVQYAGNANYVASTSNSISFTTVKEDPKILIADSPANTSVYGKAVTLTATLSDQDNDDDWIPTGSVTFYDGSSALGTARLTSGKASISLGGSWSLAGGSHSITAVYSGDSDFNTATSNALSHTITKADSATALSTTLTSSPNPSVYGKPVTISISMTSSVGALPTGTVVITDDNTTLGTITLDASASGTLTVPLLAAGTHTFTGTYSGDGNYE